MDILEYYGKNKKKIREILKKVLKKIKPSKLENAHIKATAEEIINVSSKLSKAKKIVFAGSAARDTHLKGTHDIDIFFVFPKETKIEEAAEDVRKVAKYFGKYEENYAHHPYFIINYKSYKVELVPCFEWYGGKLKSPVDRTPLHQEYVEKNLTNKDDVRLLKQFLKNNELYGAEISVGGFSGYLCELLIIYYKSFENLILEAALWKPGTRIELVKGNPPEHHLIVPDPVDPNRNVAAPVSYKKFLEFIILCREFIKNPSEKFFFWEFEPYDIHELQHLMHIKGTYFVFCLAERPKRVDDIVYGKMLNDYKNALKNLREYRLIYSDLFLNEKYCLLCFEFEDNHVINISKKKGPPIEFFEHYEKFIEKNKHALFGPYVDETICVELYDKRLSIRTVIENSIKNFDWIILEGDEILDYYDDLKVELTKFIARKHPLCFYYQQ